MYRSNTIKKSMRIRKTGDIDVMPIHFSKYCREIGVVWLTILFSVILTTGKTDRRRT